MLPFEVVDPSFERCRSYVYEASGGQLIVVRGKALRGNRIRCLRSLTLGALKIKHARVLTFRYVGALLVVAGLLIAGQYTIQAALDRQEGDSRIVNTAGRQRMLSQRLCMLLLALDVDGPTGAAANLTELARVADEWQRGHDALRNGLNSETVQRLFAQLEDDHRAMLAAARQVIAGGDARSLSGIARLHQDSYLARMDDIVAAYEREARGRVLDLRRTELALLAVLLAVLALLGLFVFRPAVRGLRAYLAERDQAQQALLEVSDREEQRIAQDLHDGLSQHLVGTSYLVKSLRQELAGGPHEARIEEVGKLLAESIDQTRGLARSLYSHTLDADGLVAALRELAATTERVFGIACRVVAATDVEVPMPARGHLYRIVREAVLNAAKHAKATAIAIEVTRNTALTIVVRDDGVGLGASPVPGMGLRLMESRAKMTGATLDIAAGTPTGTIVSCTVPIGSAP